MFTLRYIFCGHFAIETCRTSEEMRKRIKELLLSGNVDFVGVTTKGEMK